MSVGIGSVLMSMMEQGNIVGALAYAFTNYPFMNMGLIWILIGFGMYAAIFFKTDADWGVSGIILMIYLALVSSSMAPFIWIVFGLVLGVHMLILVKRVFIK